MAFGQQAGPPATARQIQQLRELLEAAGHGDFRDARGALGLTQRQSSGKFTRGEAEELVERLEAAAERGEVIEAPPASVVGTKQPRSDGGPTPRATTRSAVAAAASGGSPPLLGDVPSDVLAAELQSRGWVVLEP